MLTKTSHGGHRRRGGLKAEIMRQIDPGSVLLTLLLIGALDAMVASSCKCVLFTNLSPEAHRVAKCLVLFVLDVMIFLGVYPVIRNIARHMRMK